jgi:hypothetical protein
VLADEAGEVVEEACLGDASAVDLDVGGGEELASPRLAPDLPDMGLGLQDRHRIVMRTIPREP